MSILTDLTESQLISSKTSYRRFTGRELSDILYLNIMAFRILTAQHPDESMKLYAQKTKYYGDFDDWHFTNVTDLYLLVHGVSSGNVDVSISTDHFLGTLTLNTSQLMLWIKAAATGSNSADSYARRFLLTIDRQLRVEHLTYRSIRRLAMNWDELDLHERKLATTRLLQLMRSKCRSSDLLKKLEQFAKAHKLEIKDSSGPEHDALLTAGEHHHKLAEDDGGVATTAADIAPVVKPLGKVMRRRG